MTIKNKSLSLFLFASIILFCGCNKEKPAIAKNVEYLLIKEIRSSRGYSDLVTEYDYNSNGNVVAVLQTNKTDVREYSIAYDSFNKVDYIVCSVNGKDIYTKEYTWTEDLLIIDYWDEVNNNNWYERDSSTIYYNSNNDYQITEKFRYKYPDTVKMELANIWKDGNLSNQSINYIKNGSMADQILLNYEYDNYNNPKTALKGYKLVVNKNNILSEERESTFLSGLHSITTYTYNENNYPIESTTISKTNHDTPYVDTVVRSYQYETYEH